ncbi:hypothetical protein LTR37_002774 [Vermiconidia calcicola]|uniref:Uncharacterized protein n=1 Tax=Vermiconidia calcicola TaxID=1690605 RepID=A0ACC3NT51_9PEZI|nr:hypothetical protein LTR37_002774 [Vermiconidia calcicola]
MSRNNDNDVENDFLAAGRPRRKKRPTQKLEEIEANGETVAGLPSPSAFTDGLFGSSRSPTPYVAAIPHTARSSRMPMPSTRSGHVNSRRKEPFSAEKLLIYNWERPHPTNFLDLPDARKAWKRKADEQERAQDVDDGADDWHQLSNDIDAYSIASAFVKRAKRAFWAGRIWEEFEHQERRSYSEKKATSDQPGEHLELDNNRRMEIFDKVKRRLCQEIWLEPYRDPAGLVILPFGRRKSRNDSPMSNASSQVQRLPPTEEEAQRGIVGWDVNSSGEPEPLYGEEVEAPSGLANFMEDMAVQRRADASRGMAESQEPSLLE